MPGPTEKVAEQLHRAALRLLRRLRQADEQFEISTARLSALSVLVFVGPQTVGSLARLEQVSQPTMTSLTQALIRDGLVRAQRDATDGRVRRLLATAKGKRLLHKARARRVEMLAALLGSLPARDLEVLERSALLIEDMLTGDSSERR